MPRHTTYLQRYPYLVFQRAEQKDDGASPSFARGQMADSVIITADSDVGNCGYNMKTVPKYRHIIKQVCQIDKSN